MATKIGEKVKKIGSIFSGSDVVSKQVTPEEFADIMLGEIQQASMDYKEGHRGLAMKRFDRAHPYMKKALEDWGKAEADDSKLEIFDGTQAIVLEDSDAGTDKDVLAKMDEFSSDLKTLKTKASGKPEAKDEKGKGKGKDEKTKKNEEGAEGEGAKDGEGEGAKDGEGEGAKDGEGEGAKDGEGEGGKGGEGSKDGEGEGSKDGEGEGSETNKADPLWPADMSSGAAKAETVGIKLRRNRRSRGLKQETVAKELGIKPDLLDKVEHGNADLPKEAVAKAAKFFKIPLADLSNADPVAKRDGDDSLDFGGDTPEVKEAPDGK